MEKFLADESVDFRIVTHLREDGYEIEAIVEINPSIDDEEVLNLANEMEAILITERQRFWRANLPIEKTEQRHYSHPNVRHPNKRKN